MSDASMREILNANPGMTDSCLEEVRFGGVAAWPSQAAQCFEMGPRQRYAGLYRRGFELSRFCPAPAEACLRSNSEEMVWLEFGNQTLPPQKPDGLWEIAFYGRQTLIEGNHGHLNHYAHVTVVDELISSKELKAGEE